MGKEIEIYETDTIADFNSKNALFLQAIKDGGSISEEETTYAEPWVNRLNGNIAIPVSKITNSRDAILATLTNEEKEKVRVISKKDDAGYYASEKIKL